MQDLLQVTRCPSCQTVQLRLDNDILTCIDCGAAYPIQGGIPSLLSSDSHAAAIQELESPTGHAMVEEYGAGALPAKTNPISWLATLLRPPAVLLHTNPDLIATHTQPLFMQGDHPLRVLNVGGGPHRYSNHELTLNIEAFPNVDLVADAHNIPFADNTFDSIFSVAVLEHVYNPEQVVSEMIRVLKPGGLIYSEVPYIFFFHGYPNDFRRYTQEGMRRLFGKLDNLEIGIVSGPVSAMLQSFNMLLQMFVPARPSFLRKGINGLYRWLTFVFKYLDIPLIRWHPQAHTLAAGFYALGRKPLAQKEEER